MKYTHGTQTVETIAGKKIVKSGAVGSTNVEEVKWLTKTLVSASAVWKATGWGYICDITKMSPVTPDVSEELINLHKELAVAGCKAIAFLDFCSFMTGAQAKEHQKKSNSPFKEGHFKSEEEAVKWLEETVK